MKNKIFPHTFWRPFLDCMPQLFFRPKYVCFPVHLKGPMIPDPSGQLAELIVYITSTRVDLYSHQILLGFGVFPSLWNLTDISAALLLSHLPNFKGMWTFYHNNTGFRFFRDLAKHFIWKWKGPWFVTSHRPHDISGLAQERHTPLLTHWSYVFLALSHQYGLTW